MDISREVKEKIPTLMLTVENPGKEAITMKKERRLLKDMIYQEGGDKDVNKRSCNK